MLSTPYPAPSCGHVRQLCSEICDFLATCGGPYQRVTATLQKSTIDALVSGQYVIKKEAGQILYFASFWRIRPEDLEEVRQLRRPANITTGPFAYIVEAGSMVGLQEMIQELHRLNPGVTVAYWHRGNRLKQFRIRNGEPQDIGKSDE
jgi:hypothetical protein